MEFGVCATAAEAGMLRAAGWEFVEGNVQLLLHGEKSDVDWERTNDDGGKTKDGEGLPLVAANCLVPGHLKICGPDVNQGALREYLGRVMKRAQRVGIAMLVFGSGAARKVPEGFDRGRAREQILDFARMAADLAGKHRMLLLLEHLNRKECNIINSLDEAMEYITAVNHPHFQCLADCWHFWLEKERLESLRAAMPWVRHVHVSDLGGETGRVAPGQSGERLDYGAFFGVLKKAGYAGRICVEALWKPAMDAPGEAQRVLAFVKKAWEAA